ncbi:MAG: S8 family serine peptidase, partial [Bifidobacteriaceae bacterium]|nr:S8 family serine peptidase [Bifidobacteriaceae bacterium]
MAEQVAAGFDGRGVTVAVLDGFIDTSLGLFEGADIETRSFCGYPVGLEGFGTSGLAPAELRPEDLPDSYDGAGVAGSLQHGTGVTALLVGNGAQLGGEPGTLGVAPGARVLHYVVASDVVAEAGWQLCWLDGESVGVDYDGAVVAALEAGADIISVSSSLSVSGETMALVDEADVILVAGLSNDEERSGSFPRVRGAVQVRGHGEDGELT